MKLIYALQILKNSPKNCLCGKIIIHIANIILWFTLFFVTYVVVFIPNEPSKKFIGILCLLGFFADFLCMSSVVPVLGNPYKEKDKNNDCDHDYKADIEAATLEANAPGASLGNLL